MKGCLQLTKGACGKQLVPELGPKFEPQTPLPTFSSLFYMAEICVKALAKLHGSLATQSYNDCLELSVLADPPE